MSSPSSCAPSGKADWSGAFDLYAAPVNLATAYKHLQVGKSANAWDLFRRAGGGSTRTLSLHSISNISNPVIVQYSTSRPLDTASVKYAELALGISSTSR
jgi:hypothetical protein